MAAAIHICRAVNRKVESVRRRRAWSVSNSGHAGVMMFFPLYEHGCRGDFSSPLIDYDYEYYRTSTHDASSNIEVRPSAMPTIELLQ